MFIATLATSIARQRCAGIAMIASGVPAVRIHDAISRCCCVFSRLRLSISSMIFTHPVCRPKHRTVQMLSHKRRKLSLGTSTRGSESRHTCISTGKIPGPSLVRVSMRWMPPQAAAANQRKPTLSEGLL